MNFTYKLTWLEYWSEKRDHADPRVNTIFREESDGWFEHEHIYNFIAENDEKAREKALKFIGEQSTPVEAFTVTRTFDNKVIMTEEKA